MVEITREKMPSIVPQDDPELVRALGHLLETHAPRSHAEALKLIRTAYPQHSLSHRLATLAEVMRRRPGALAFR